MAAKGTGTGTVLTVADLHVLTEKLVSIAYQWYQLGIQLEFNPGVLKAIESGTFHVASRGLDELLTQWLQRTKPPPTLQSLIDVVGGKTIANQALAGKLYDERGDFPSIKAGGQAPISTTQASSTDADKELSGSDMFDISSYLEKMEKAKVLILGGVLGLDYSKLKNNMKSDTFLLDTIHSWLQKEDNVTAKGAPTWRALVNALKTNQVGQAGIAAKITKDMGIE